MAKSTKKKKKPESKWVILSTRNATSYRASYKIVRAICPLCTKEVETRATWVETHEACQGCERNLPGVLARLKPEFVEKINRKYAQHLKTCEGMGAPPASYENFVLEYSRDPDLMDDDDQVEPEIGPSMPSPLAWNVRE